MKLFPSVMVVLAAMVAAPGAAEAQVVGTFTWQTRPYCNLVTLSVIQVGAAYQLTGSDNLCGAGVAPISGTAVPNGGGGVALGFAVALPTGRTAHLTATVNLATVSGTWTDADGSAGPFVFTTAGNGGPQRPAPASASAITVNQFAPTVYAGTGAAGTVARSDHDHDARYPPRTTTVRLSGFALQLQGDARYYSTNGCIANATDSTAGIVLLPLPLGATLNAVALSVYDHASTASYGINLERHTQGATSMTSDTIRTASGGSLSNTVVTHDLAIPPGTVVAANHAYFLYFATSPMTNGLCSVQYTYTAPPAN
jgi:hypothetical protein